MRFDHKVTLAARPDLFLTGITDMVVGQTALGPVLYTASRLGGGDLLAYRIAPDGALILIDRQAMPGETRAGVTNKLSMTEGDTGPALLMTGAGNVALTRISIAADGTLSNPVSVTGAQVPSRLVSSAMIEHDDQTFLYGVSRGSDAVGVWRMNANGTVTLVEDGALAGSAGVGLTGLVAAPIKGVPFLLVASATDHALISMAVSSDGRPREVARISAADGVGIATPSNVVAIDLEGQRFAVLAASDSSTLTVVALAADGSMRVTDHVIDTLNTRFAGVHAMETVTFKGRAYIAVAGGDDGVSVFELGEDGRLHHIETIVDTLDTTLDAVSAIGLTVHGDSLHLAVTSSVEAGLSLFSLDLSQVATPVMGTGGADFIVGGIGDDRLIGGAGNDTVSGGTGDDILIDGAGTDRLIGGAGADRFVLSGDGSADTIVDFDIARDTIDLSGWAFLRSSGQLDYTVTGTGGILSFNGETLTIHTVDARPLTLAQIESLDLIQQSRFLPSWVLPDEPDTPSTPETDAPSDVDDPPEEDTPLGCGGNFPIVGRDRVISDAGAARLADSTGSESFENGIASDRLRGDPTDDFIWGGDGGDAFWGPDLPVRSGPDGWNLKLVGNTNPLSRPGGMDQETSGGNAGSEILVLGTGEDLLSDRIGADTFIFASGSDGTSDVQTDVDMPMSQRSVWSGGTLNVGHLSPPSQPGGGANVALDFATGEIFELTNFDDLNILTGVL